MTKELSRPKVPQWFGFEPLPLQPDKWEPGQLLLASRPKAKGLFVFRGLVEETRGERLIKSAEALEFPEGEPWSLGIPCSGLWDQIEAVNPNNLTQEQFGWYEELRARVLQPDNNEG